MWIREVFTERDGRREMSWHPTDDERERIVIELEDPFGNFYQWRLSELLAMADFGMPMPAGYLIPDPTYPPDSDTDHYP